MISGFTGQFTVINGNYTPMPKQHKNFKCWKHDDIAVPCTIFHTGKSRWVISKELDDGQTCFAFVPADSGAVTPAKCTGRWTYFDNEQQQWRDDPQIKCLERSAGSDPFMRVKAAVDAELDRVGVMDDRRRAQLWRRCDVDGDGTCDLLEIETLIKDLTKTKVWPDFLNCGNEIIAKAFEQTLQCSIDGDSEVDKDEFHTLLSNVFWFAKLWGIWMEAQSSGDDNKLDKSEFKACIVAMGVQLSDLEVDEAWSHLGKDSNGEANFDEFCVFVRRRVCGEGQDHKDDADQHMEKTLMTMTTSNSATMGGMVSKKNFDDFDKLEKKIKTICSSNNGRGIQKLWSTLDYNGNGLVSLAEFDKMVTERYPVLNHKPALMRAFQDAKASDQSRHTQHSEDFVTKREFKRLLTNLFYYNKLFWLFDQADHGQDRRIDFKEWQWCLSMSGEMMSEAAARAEFRKIDRNGGGQILFDEFCAYFVQKKCPQGMTDFITHG